MGGRKSPEVQRRAAKKWKDKNPDYYADHHRKRKYGMYFGQYDEMYKFQHGVCYICKNPQIQSNRVQSLCVDHNHLTGKVRKLLCTSCNVALGNAKDSVKLLQQMINYLNEHTDDLQEEIRDDS